MSDSKREQVCPERASLFQLSTKTRRILLIEVGEENTLYWFISVQYESGKFGVE